MIVVRVELWSAITGEKSTLALMSIANDGEGSRTRGNYIARAYKGRSEEALLKAMHHPMKVSHQGEVKNHARLSEHVWNLVAKCLTACGYGTSVQPIPPATWEV